MNTHHSKVELIRARIKTLTCREFAEFATDASFEDRHASKSISFRQEEVLNGFFAQIAHYQGIGQSVKVVEVLADYEIPHVERFIREAQAAGEMAQDVTTEVTNTTDAEAQALPIDALSTRRRRCLSVSRTSMAGRMAPLPFPMPSHFLRRLPDRLYCCTAGGDAGEVRWLRGPSCLIPPAKPMPRTPPSPRASGPSYCTPRAIRLRACFF